LWQGDPLTAEQLLLPAYDALKEIGEKNHFTSIAPALASALYDQGRYREAEQLTHESEEAARPNDIYAEISWRSVRAKALARGGAYRAAEPRAPDAVGRAEASDFLPARAEAVANLAEVLELQGRRDEAIEAYRTALGLHAKKGNKLAVRRTAATLEGLTGSP